MDLLLNFIKMNYTQKLITYMSTVKEYINEKAVFSDETLILEILSNQEKMSL